MLASGIYGLDFIRQERRDTESDGIVILWMG
jgi:hypothetical protein